MEYFEANNIFKSFPEINIEFSFTAKKGSFTSIVGKSGSGKTTVLRTIAGVDGKSKSSTIILDGKDISALPPQKRECAMVFQTPALFLTMSVEDNVGYALRCRGVPRKESRAKAGELLEKLGISSLAKRFPETLSGGEAQRVSLARTLIASPKLLLLDEPMSALDAPLRKKLAADLRKWQQEMGLTAVMVTHDLEEAKAVSDRIIIMANGTKRWEGDAASFSEDLFCSAAEDSYGR